MMPNPEISVDIIHELLESKGSEFEQLKAIYDKLPDTRCARKTHCCSMLPEATLLEALAAFECLGQMPDGQQRGIFTKLIEYFFINPAQVTACPFLDQNRCMIYDHRFFGCRAYGLWSKSSYEKMAAFNRRAKLSLKQQWRRLGISLPQKILDFQVPYCLDVEILNRAVIDDGMLIQISHDIKALSDQLSPWNQIYDQQYVGDLSFLVAAMANGIQSALRMKVDIVRELVATADRTRLDQILKNTKRKPLPFRSTRADQL